MDEYTEGWEAHKLRVIEIIETMIEEGVEYPGALENFHFRLLGL